MLKKILAAKSFECFAFNLDHFTPRSKLHLKLHIKLFTQNAVKEFLPGVPSPFLTFAKRLKKNRKDFLQFL